MNKNLFMDEIQHKCLIIHRELKCDHIQNNSHELKTICG